jgi:two-component system, OmpR family, alkaline phosphatase synthesis response regulator PhoP
MSDPTPKKVLIADDEAFIRLLIEQTLEDVNGVEIELLSAENGADALQTILTQAPSLVFLDVMMPRMNGFDVCREVKQNAGMDQVYIILLTAKGQEYDRQIGMEAGADLYMTKPFDPDELLELAQRVLAG